MFLLDVLPPDNIREIQVYLVLTELRAFYTLENQSLNFAPISIHLTHNGKWKYKNVIKMCKKYLTPLFQAIKLFRITCHNQN